MPRPSNTQALSKFYSAKKIFAAKNYSRPSGRSRLFSQVPSFLGRYPGVSTGGPARYRIGAALSLPTLLTHAADQDNDVILNGAADHLSAVTSIISVAYWKCHRFLS